MAQVLVRRLDAKTLRALKKRAAFHNRSFQQELKTIMDGSAQESLVDQTAVACRLRKVLG